MKERKELRAIAQDLRTTLDQFRKDILTDNARKLINMAMPHCVFLDRFENDYPNLKNDVAERVVSKFFKKPLQCFVQASTTAIHLAKELANSPSVTTGNLIYTNSVVFPLFMLREGSPNRLYAFCGPLYDPECGGWLFPTADIETENELSRLFTRDNNPLTTAFVMPAAMVPDGRIFFKRDDTNKLIKILAQEAEHLVIMTVGDRMRSEEKLKSSSDSPQYSTMISPKNQPNKKVSLVISGRPSTGDLLDFGNALANVGLDVQWHDHNRQWHEFESR